MKQTKVIVIGTGAAGLMAAKTLKSQGIDFIVLESTDHVGGRAQTLKGNPHIEFGPEYLHGETPLTDKLLEEYRIPYYDLQFDYHVYHHGKLKPLPDFWERLCGVLKDINVKGKDISFAEYISRYDRHSELDKEISRTFVEGFDAADLNQVSSKALGDMNEIACDPKIRRMRRPLHGYGELMEKMAEDILPHILFTYVVHEIEWKKGHVIVRGVTGKGQLPFEILAEKVLDTVSVGVLKKQKLTPRPRELERFLDQVEMGQVVKMVAELDPEFFHNFENNAFPFISSPELSFTAWWTTTPIHSNTVTAWAGGEKARKLCGISEDARKDIFVQQLSEITSQPPQKIKDWIKNIYHHDWSDDPSFLGAYSYPKVIRTQKEEVKTEFDNTLFFAGEAFHEEFSGTIEGALLTGRDAAIEIIGLRSEKWAS